MEHESNGHTNCNWCIWNSLQGLRSEIGSVGNQRTSQDRLNYSFVKIGQNTKKSPGDLRRLVVTQIQANAGVKKKNARNNNNNNNDSSWEVARWEEFVISADHRVKIKESEKKR